MADAVDMIVFIAWSKQQGREIAETIQEWIPKVNPYIKPFVSSKDIEIGSNWLEELHDRLSMANFGILCLTPESLSTSWIYYEAGAMQTAMRNNNPGGKVRIAPILFGVKNADIPGPLRDLQSKAFDRDSMWNLAETMNDICMNLYGESLRNASSASDRSEKTYLEPDDLKFAFDAHYAKLENQITDILNRYVSSGTTSRQNPPAGTDSALQTPKSGNTPTQKTESENASTQSSSSGDTTHGPSGSTADFIRTNMALSCQLENLYMQFGFYPEIGRVYFEGRQLLDVLTDSGTSKQALSESFTRFYDIIDDTVRTLRHDIADSNPNRKIRIDMLKNIQKILDSL